MLHDILNFDPRPPPSQLAGGFYVNPLAILLYSLSDLGVGGGAHNFDIFLW